MATETKPKLTEKQWEVLERMEASVVYTDGHKLGDSSPWIVTAAYFIVGGTVPTPTLSTLRRKGMIEHIGDQIDSRLGQFTVSDAGRAALAARRAEKGKVANG
jgi:hypothetical protein